MKWFLLFVLCSRTRGQQVAVYVEELLEQLQHQAIQPTKVEEFQERLDALREDKPAADQAIPVQSVDERFAQVQRLVDGGPTPAQAGPSTSAGATTAAVASTSTGLGAELGRIQAETLVGENTGTLAHALRNRCCIFVRVFWYPGAPH